MTRYEDDMVIVGNYNGYVKCAEAFLRLGLSHQVSEKCVCLLEYLCTTVPSVVVLLTVF